MVPGLQPALVPGLQTPATQSAGSTTSSLLESFPPPPAASTPSETTAQRMMAHMADMGKFHMSFYPCGGDEWEEDEASHNFLKNLKPKLCNMQCTSLTERLQLALLDHPHGIDSPFLNPKEKSFLDAMSQAERRRMFSLTDEEQAFLDGGKEGEDITMPSLPSSSAGTQTRSYPLSKPVKHLSS